jgi:hypothetical protein
MQAKIHKIKYNTQQFYKALVTLEEAIHAKDFNDFVGDILERRCL